MWRWEWYTKTPKKLPLWVVYGKSSNIMFNVFHCSCPGPPSNQLLSLLSVFCIIHYMFYWVTVKNKTSSLPPEGPLCCDPLGFLIRYPSYPSNKFTLNEANIQCNISNLQLNLAEIICIICCQLLWCEDCFKADKVTLNHLSHLFLGMFLFQSVRCDKCVSQ